jgi:hypothetical protein
MTAALRHVAIFDISVKSTRVSFTKNTGGRFMRKFIKLFVLTVLFAGALAWKNDANAQQNKSCPTGFYLSCHGDHCACKAGH